MIGKLWKLKLSGILLARAQERLAEWMHVQANYKQTKCSMQMHEKGKQLRLRSTNLPAKSRAKG